MPGVEFSESTIVNLNALIAALERFPATLTPLVSGVADADLRWKPDDGSWSMLEIVMHLADEETEDFRTRVELTLRDPGATWPPIDPEGWAVARRYNEADSGAALARFVEARADSVRRLRGLTDPDWDRAFVHPKFGPIRAGDVLVSWVAHDALHLRQLAKRRYQLALRDGAPFSAAYAGPWV